MSKNNYSILFIDDDHLSRELIGACLQDRGYELFLASNGEEGLELFSRYAPDIVLLDLRMPGLNGFQVLKRIVAQNDQVPVLVVSGIGEMDDVIKAVRLGAWNYVVKSLDNLSVLEEAVEMVVQHLQLLREKQHTQQKLVQALDENKRVRTQLKTIFESLPDGIMTVNDQGQVLEYNQAMQTLCPIGCKLELNKSIRDLLPENNDSCLRIIKKTLTENRKFLNRRIECPYLKPSRKVLLATTSPLHNDQDELTGATLILKDISRQEELEEKLQERRKLRNIIGKSGAMQRVYALISQLANVDSTVLIAGESGTGKECVMDALHHTGQRKEGPLCKVNCSALSRELLDSELFGHVKGAFTGAHQDKIGRFEMAHKGTIFLDEIGEISHNIQLKLLRFLETKAFEKVGSSKTIKVDVRIISATNVDLGQKVQDGEFREDLYYRLKVLSIPVPPLREHKDDIPLLVDYFCRHFSQEFKKEILGVSSQVMKLFFNYDWPGNIRELKHALEHGCLLSPGGEVTLDDLPLELIDYHKSNKLDMLSNNPRELTRKQLEEALAQSQGNKVRAAELLGIHRKTLYRKIHQLGLPLK
jgi:PAS domain S-box-containing protein